MSNENKYLPELHKPSVIAKNLGHDHTTAYVTLRDYKKAVTELQAEVERLNSVSAGKQKAVEFFSDSCKKASEKIQQLEKENRELVDKACSIERLRVKDYSDHLNETASYKTEFAKLKKQLKVAVDALEFYESEKHDGDDSLDREAYESDYMGGKIILTKGGKTARQALEQIRTMSEGVK